MAKRVMYKYGICTNVDYNGGKCPRCESKEKQKIRAGADFVCEECHERLHQVAAPKTFGQKYGKLFIALGVLVVLGGVAFAVVSLSGRSSDEPVTEEVIDSPNETLDSPETAGNDSVETKVPDKTSSESVPASSAVSKKDLGYAVYSGRLKDGMPNDEQAKLTFKSRHIIDSRDPQKREAEAGDYVIGEFVDGHLVQGIWYDSSNTVKQSIIIGM